MSVLYLCGRSLDVDIEGELREYEWDRSKWAGDKLIAASPFRYDRTPSFMVNLSGEYAGTFVDSGAYDVDYESGNFPKLLAFLRDETYEETCDYLLERYAPNVDNTGRVEIPKVSIHPPHSHITLSPTILSELQYRSPYLERRGISEKVQRFMGIGYSRSNRAVSMPWRHANGTLANVKYRKTQGKAFWYEKGAAPIRTLVYGIDKIYHHNLTEAVVCEAEIDAMSWMTAGKPAIALGGTTITQVQLDIIRKSPLERIIIAEDNDKAGGKLGKQLTEGLRGYLEIAQIKIPSEYKDANEALVGGIDLSILPIKYVRNGYGISLV